VWNGAHSRCGLTWVLTPWVYQSEFRISCSNSLLITLFVRILVLLWTVFSQYEWLHLLTFLAPSEFFSWGSPTIIHFETASALANWPNPVDYSSYGFNSKLIWIYHHMNSTNFLTIIHQLLTSAKNISLGGHVDFILS